MRQFTTALLAAIALAGIGASSANAADPVPDSWTGFYAGLNVGYDWSNVSGNGTLGAATATGSETLTGIIGGGQIGYNWQMANNIVLGVEADFQGSDASSSTNKSYYGFAYSGTDRMTYFGTIRGRVGYMIDRWLPYITAGFGYGQGTTNATLSGVRTFSEAQSNGAWVVGAGVETALTGKWTVKFEYLAMGADIQNSFNTSRGTLTVNGTVLSNVVRTGLNYRF